MRRALTGITAFLFGVIMTPFITIFILLETLNIYE
jgi:hypothetical protein